MKEKKKIKISEVAGEHLLISNRWLSSRVPKGKAFWGTAVRMWMDLHWRGSQVRKSLLVTKEWDAGTFLSPWHAGGAERATRRQQFRISRGHFCPQSQLWGFHPLLLGQNSQRKAKGNNEPKPSRAGPVSYRAGVRHRTHKGGGKKLNQTQKEKKLPPYKDQCKNDALFFQEDLANNRNLMPSYLSWRRPETLKEICSAQDQLVLLFKAKNLAAKKLSLGLSPSPLLLIFSLLFSPIFFLQLPLIIFNESSFSQFFLFQFRGSFTEHRKIQKIQKNFAFLWWRHSALLKAEEKPWLKLSLLWPSLAKAGIWATNNVRKSLVQLSSRCTGVTSQDFGSALTHWWPDS